jgi:beta-galactosidase
MLSGRIVLISLCAAATVFAAGAVKTAERRQSFNDDWRFFKGDAPGAEAPEFADSAWRALRLPHDWAIEGPFDSKLNPHTGGLPVSGTGWYRKHFTVADSLRDRRLSIEFDGAMANSTVWLNGHELGGRPYGYIGFGFDLTPYLRYGAEDNVLAVRLQPEPDASRWYPGAGIYRNVWLEVTAPVHVARWGTYVTTPEVSDASATVALKTELRNQGTAESRLTLRTSILNPAGRQVARQTSEAAVGAGATETVATTLTVPRPERWDVDHPDLYTLVSEVLDGSRVVDRYTTPFGIRTIAFDRDKGFLLNGRRVPIQGVCDHHDLGALGAAVNRRAIERQLEILKGAGVNALRTSHNPPAPEVLEACDRMGILVMDEAFDVWKMPKVRNGYQKYFDEWSERDLRDMARRDRNHPSIILWSIGNEVMEQGSPTGAPIARRLTGLFHEEDPTRPTTAAFNRWDAAIKNELAANVDIPGFNYQPSHYEQIEREHPKWVIFGSETASAVSSRGVYELPLEDAPNHATHQVSSYDVVAASWAMPPDVEWTYEDKLGNIPGEFVWTGFDYIGEPTPFWGRGATVETDWPARSSYFGFVDLAGFPKDRYYLYQSHWTSKPMVHVDPQSWNWEGREGQNIPVFVYSNADEVELFLNDRSLGRKARFSKPVELPVGAIVSPDRKFTSKYRLLWQVPYAPGVLKAVGYSGSRQVAADEVHTAGTPARIRLVPDRAKIAADGEDLSFVTVRIEDQDGNLCPAADNLVHFAVTGAGAIRTVDNGNAATVEPFQANRRKAFNGMALLIVEGERGKAGAIHVTATADGLSRATAEIVAAK